jgi:hypothetical protein
VEEASGVKIELNGGRFVVGGKWREVICYAAGLPRNGIIASCICTYVLYYITIVII